jgi:hypothetical protein
MTGRKKETVSKKPPIPVSVNIVRSNGAPVKTVIVKPDGCCIEKKGASR